MKYRKIEIGDRVSYQCAGMAQPEYGVVSGFPRLQHGLFIRFDGEQQGKFVDLTWLRQGQRPSWWRQDADGKWHCND